jgi:hypothetical protein
MDDDEKKGSEPDTGPADGPDHGSESGQAEPGPVPSQGTFLYVQPGDTVLRLLAGTIPMHLRVESVDDRLIHCSGGWTFDRQTGVEEDPELGWGVSFGVTGSFLVHRQ